MIPSAAWRYWRLTDPFCSEHGNGSDVIVLFTPPPKKIAPFLLGDRVLHVTHGTFGLSESSSQTASRSVRPFLYESQRLCCTMHCQWGRKNPQNCPFPLGFRHPARGGPSNGHRQHPQKIGKDSAWDSGDILADRQTDTQTHRHTQSITDRRAHHNTSPPLQQAK